MATEIHYAFLGINAPLPANIARVNQVHGTDCLHFTAVMASPLPQADALITDTKDLWLGVQTADCAPILLMGDNMVGAAHAGWRGALAGVIDKSVEKMGNPADLRAIIGPCIHKKSYEVSAGFEKPFLDESGESGHFFTSSNKPDKLLFDLPSYCSWRLARCGVKQVEISPIDTLTDPSFNSYRRNATANRNWSLIKLGS